MSIAPRSGPFLLACDFWPFGQHGNRVVQTSEVVRVVSAIELSQMKSVAEPLELITTNVLVVVVLESRRRKEFPVDESGAREDR